MQETAISRPGSAQQFLGRTMAVHGRITGIRDPLLRPFVVVVSGLGISADLVSIASVVLVVPMVFVARSHPWMAVCCLFASLLADQIDGAVARIQGTSSDRGKLVDMVCDNLAFTVFVIALVRVGLVGPIIGLLLAYTMVVSKTFRSVLHGQTLPSDWLFRSVAGFAPNFLAAVLYLLFLLFAATGREFFVPVGAAFSVVLAIDALHHLSRLLKLDPESRKASPGQQRRTVSAAVDGDSDGS